MEEIDSKYLEFWRKRFETQKLESLALADSARADLPKAVEILRNYGARRIFLYGSLCRTGRFHPRSDIDLIVEGIPPGLFVRAASDLMMSMDWPIDLKPYEDLDGFFRDSVMRKGELIYAEKGRDSGPGRRDQG
jgi:predicted nucleotidyltransferase